MTSAAILAGGHARRFGGREKGALLVGGRTILARQLDEIAPVAGDIAMVGGAESEAVRAERLKRPGIRLVADRMPERGPLGGLDAALASARGEPLVVVACDMPFVSSRLLAYLVSLAGLDGSAAVVPRTERGYHPLCAVYTRACHEAVKRQLAQGRLRMVELLAGIHVRVVDAGELEPFGDPRRLFANVNTPGDLSGLGVPTLQECHEP
jgi:molybdopterin-guanine dinucleotide biosynthesis protein A